MAHEITHRWCSSLLWKAPDTFALLDVTRSHWSNFLVTTVATPVWPLLIGAWKRKPTDSESGLV